MIKARIPPEIAYGFSLHGVANTRKMRANNEIYMANAKLNLNVANATIFHLLAFGGNANVGFRVWSVRLVRYQHVGISYKQSKSGQYFYNRSSHRNNLYDKTTPYGQPKLCYTHTMAA